MAAVEHSVEHGEETVVVVPQFVSLALLAARADAGIVARVESLLRSSRPVNRDAIFTQLANATCPLSLTTTRPTPEELAYVADQHVGIITDEALHPNDVFTLVRRPCSFILFPTSSQSRAVASAITALIERGARKFEVLVPRSCEACTDEIVSLPLPVGVEVMLGRSGPHGWETFAMRRGWARN
jgi:hypothetical protein